MLEVSPYCGGKSRYNFGELPIIQGCHYTRLCDLYNLIDSNRLYIHRERRKCYTHTENAWCTGTYGAEQDGEGEEEEGRDEEGEGDTHSGQHTKGTQDVQVLFGHFLYGGLSGLYTSIQPMHTSVS